MVALPLGAELLLTPPPGGVLACTVPGVPVQVYIHPDCPDHLRDLLLQHELVHAEQLLTGQLVVLHGAWIFNGHVYCAAEYPPAPSTQCEWLTKLMWELQFPWEQLAYRAVWDDFYPMLASMITPNDLMTFDRWVNSIRWEY